MVIRTRDESASLDPDRIEIVAVSGVFTARRLSSTLEIDSAEGALMSAVVDEDEAEDLAVESARAETRDHGTVSWESLKADLAI